MRRRPDPSQEGGTAAVEFALVLPLVLVVALALVQTGLVVRDRLLVEAAARAGARAAAVEEDPAAIRSAALAAAPSLVDGAVVLDVSRVGVRGEPVTVSLRYDAPVRVPFVEWLFGTAIGIAAETTARQEFG
ncbi:MAG TPA: TadE/TadG family type IV pilus assembly protein [Actinomycetota bacterium]|nr:TadE/TadG family type IV pilus assembly protein [Actinomycetota bacterium]